MRRRGEEGALGGARGRGGRSDPFTPARGGRLRSIEDDRGNADEGDGGGGIPFLPDGRINGSPEAILFEWTERWSVGVDTIDAQHRELFAAINTLLREEGKTPSRDLARVLDYLEGYISNHFGLEELYMRRLSYPGFPSHKGEHVAFINDFYDLRDEYDNNGASPELADKMGRYMGDWLVNHIGKVDKALGAFLQETGKK
ncbi:MAG: hypothetical protein B7Z62_06245 [Deltaproteobacteria bacterium 37-65-8]|nr:MAG: hypothetical protein B7Z62_06245 [Deltaproteobacteria bacterium 37-65-8]